MPKANEYVSGFAIFLAGLAAGVLTGAKRERAQQASAPADTASAAQPKTAEPNPPRPEAETAIAHELRRSMAMLESRLAAQEALATTRFGQIEARIEEHAAKLAEAPSTAQIVGAMEQLLAKTMASLDERLSTQAHSIEVLKTTVSQTDNLLERVLESLDTLQGGDSPAVENALFSRPI